MNLANLRRNLHLTALLFVLSASPALADLSWNYTSGNESFSLITTGEPADVLAHPPGSVNFTAIDFVVHTSTLFSGANGKSVSGGDMFISNMWSLNVTWNGIPGDTGFGCGGGSGCWISFFFNGTNNGYQLYERFGGVTNRAFLVQGRTDLLVFYANVTPVLAPAAVPEPGAMFLMGSGLAGLMAFRHRRRRTPNETSA